MFLHVSVILSTGGSASVHAGIQPPPSRVGTPKKQAPPQKQAPPGAAPPEQTPPGAGTLPEMATVADSTHPTGMHSCFH